MSQHGCKEEAEVSLCVCMAVSVCMQREWMAIPAVSSGHMAVGWPGSHMVAASSKPRGHALLQDIPCVLKVLQVPDSSVLVEDVEQSLVGVGKRGVSGACIAVVSKPPSPTLLPLAARLVTRRHGRARRCHRRSE